MDIKIPKDPRDFKPKFIAGFTMRQFFALMGVIVIAYLNVAIQKNVLGLESIINMPILIPSIIPLFLGFGEPLVGMPPEKYIQLVFISAFIAPKIRVYKTHNMIEMYEAAAIKEEKKAEKLAESKKQPEKKNKARKRKPVEIPEELVAYY